MAKSQPSGNILVGEFQDEIRERDAVYRPKSLDGPTVPVMGIVNGNQDEDEDDDDDGNLSRQGARQRHLHQLMIHIVEMFPGRKGG
jgi:hypothetical protein